MITHHRFAAALAAGIGLAVLANQARAAGQGERAQMVNMLLSDPSAGRPSDRRASQIASSIEKTIAAFLPESGAKPLAAQAIEQKNRFTPGPWQAGKPYAHAFGIGDESKAAVGGHTGGRFDTNVEYQYHDGLTHPTFRSAWRKITVGGVTHLAHIQDDAYHGYVFTVARDADQTHGQVEHTYKLEHTPEGGVSARWIETGARGGNLSRRITPTADEVSEHYYTGPHIAPTAHKNVIVSRPRTARAARK
jgi:hypothetical protein